MEPDRRQPRITLSISPQVSELLTRLVRLGMWGRNRADVAQRLLYLAIREQFPPREAARGK